METKLERWENSVETWPSKAEKFGPPNWLVCEEWKKKADGKPAEPFETAAERVKLRYFPVGHVSDKGNVGQNVGQFTVRDNKCADCLEPWSGRGSRCWACQKRRQRDGVTS